MLIPPRELIEPALHERAVADFPPAASVPGARALGLDGLLYASQKHDGLSYAWKPIAAGDPAGAQGVVQLAEDISVTVGGPGADFQTLTAALLYLAQFQTTPRTGSGDYLPYQQGTITIQSGWAAQEQVLLDGVSLGWVRIVSEDATVPVDEAALVQNEEFYDTTGNFPFILARNGAVCPRIKTLFVCDPDGAGRPTTGLHLRSARYLDDLNHDTVLPQAHGFEGFAVNCRVHSGSEAFFTYKSFDSAGDRCLTAEHGSHVAYVACRAYGAGNDAIEVASGSRLHSFGLTHPTAGQVLAAARADAAGLADSANDWRVTTGGQISLVPTTLGGISQPANVWTANGLIHDGRVAATTYSGIIAPKSYTVATLPAASTHAGQMVHVTDGDAGSPCFALSDGTDWLRIAAGAAVSAT